MKKGKAKRQPREVDRDTMRPEYDFSKGVRGVTAARYREGTNVVVLDPSVMDVFPDSDAVNEASSAANDPKPADPPKIDSGDTAWMLVSTALVLLMVPGRAYTCSLLSMRVGVAQDANYRPGVAERSEDKKK